MRSNAREKKTDDDDVYDTKQFKNAEVDRMGFDWGRE